MMKPLAVVASLVCFGVVSAMGQAETTSKVQPVYTTNSYTTNSYTTYQEEPVQKDRRFHSGQFEVSPFATFAHNVGDDWGGGVALTCYPIKQLGIGASTFWTDWHGSFIDNLAGEVYFRLPIFKIVAPYAVGSVGYQFDGNEWFETLGGGVDLRPLKNIALFSDVQWRFNNDSEDGIFVRLGMRFAF